MKYIKLTTLAGLLAASATTGFSAISITNFGNTAFTDDLWTYNSASSSLSGQEGLGYLLYGEPISTNFTGVTAITLTANVLAGSAPANGFTFLLLDGQDDSATAIFDWSQFINGATVTAQLTNISPAFDAANVVGWNLVGGSSNSTVSVTFTSAIGQTAAIPEPSSYAIIAGMGVLSVAAIRRRKHS